MVEGKKLHTPFQGKEKIFFSFFLNDNFIMVEKSLSVREKIVYPFPTSISPNLPILSLVEEKTIIQKLLFTLLFTFS